MIFMQETFKNRMKQILNEEYDAFMNSLQQKSYKAIHLNTGKPNIKKYMEDHFSITKHPYVNDGYYFDYETLPLGKLSLHQAGLYYIQEPSAMLVGELLEVKENDVILDLCAAPGGKSCHVATKLNQTGLLISNEIHAKRAKILSENIERFGFDNVIVTNNTPSSLAKKFPVYFDKIIIDAPCSGEGMFRKTDQAITTWSLDKIKENSNIQKQLIDQAFSMLKDNGIIAYSTCTYSREENEDIINYALDNYPLEVIPIEIKEGFTKDLDDLGAIRLYPHKFKGEGHFICLLRKNTSDTNTTNTTKSMKASISKQQFKLVDEFYKENLLLPTPPTLLAFNNHIYQIKDNFPMIDTIKLLRYGLYLGECKKKRFEPSHSLALTLSIEKVKRYYSYQYDDEHIINYLKGEVLVGSNQKGYGVIFIDEYPFSFYKESNNQVKNLYPKGLRR